MRLPLGLVMAGIVHAAAADTPSVPLTAAETQSVEAAMLHGKALYSAYQSRQPQQGADIAAARAFVQDFCADLTYTAVTMQAEGAPVIYFIGVARDANAVVFGRHYRVAGAAVAPSNKSCMIVPNSREAVAAITTHFLTDTPTEFHVFESLAHPAVLYVMTRAGVWTVHNGDIQLLKRNAETAVPPADRPAAYSKEQLAARDHEIAPLITQARESFSDVRRRFLAGLPRDEHLSVVTRLTDDRGHVEQVFVGVDSIHDGKIEGRIISQIGLVAGHKYGDHYVVPDGEILDWVISKADGSEEGNLIGKHLEGR